MNLNLGGPHTIIPYHMYIENDKICMLYSIVNWWYSRISSCYSSGSRQRTTPMSAQAVVAEAVRVIVTSTRLLDRNIKMLKNIGHLCCRRSCNQQQLRWLRWTLRNGAGRSVCNSRRPSRIWHIDLSSSPMNTIENANDIVLFRRHASRHTVFRCPHTLSCDIYLCETSIGGYRHPPT